MNPHLAPGLCVVYPSESPPVESSYFHTKLHELCSPRLQLQEHTAPVEKTACHGEDGWMSRRFEMILKGFQHI